MMIPTLELLVAINQFFYCYSLVPQIIQNYRLKTGSGLSYGLLFVLFNCLLGLSFCFFCLNMPVAYRVSIAIQLFFVGILLGQRIYYSARAGASYALWAFIGNLVFGLFIVPVALRYPEVVGHTAGWVGVVLLVLNRVPQMVKVQRARSVYGFNYGFVGYLACAAVMEFIIVWVFKLPTQTLFTSSISIISSIIFTYQFWRFSWSKGR